MNNVTLAELCSLIVDSEHKTAPKTPDGAHPLIRTADLGRARANLSNAQRVDSKTYALWTKRAKPTTSDLILAREAPVGGIYRIPQGVKPVLGQRTVLLRPNPNVVDSRFLMYRLAADDLQARMAEMSTGSTVPHLNMVDIRQFPLPPLPSLVDQQRIAGVLGTLDELIDINERRIELLEDLARSLYREWFVHFRFPGSKEASFTESEMGRVPNGWAVRSLRELVTTQYGLTASAVGAGGGPKFLRGKDINKRSFINWSEVSYCAPESEMFEKFRLRVGDICVIRMADPGKVGIVESHVDAAFGSYLVRLRSIDPRLPPYLLFHYLDSREYQSWVSGSSTGSTRKSASAGVLTEPLVALPPLEIASCYELQVSAFRKLLTNLVETSGALVTMRDLLLPRLVSNQLDISGIDLGVLAESE